MANMIYDFQKASFLKRISAFLLDFILVVIFMTFFAWIISMITNYNAILEEFSGYYTKYEGIYNIKLTDQNAFEAFTQEQLDTYNKAIEAMNADEEVLRCWGLVSTLPVVMVSVGLLLSTLLVEFIMPLILKNGQTVGKKVFKIGVVNENGVICSNFQLFARALLGKCAIEYMIPGIIIVMMCLGTMGILGPLVILGLLVIQIIVFAMNPTRPFLHDLIGKTAVCDLSTQMIFKDYDELIKFKEEIGRQKAQASVY